jgi:hypothetical protein
LLSVQPIPQSAPKANTVQKDSGSAVKSCGLQLPKDGIWHLQPYGPDAAYSQKIQWWRKSYEWRTDMPSKLKVTGERIDSPAPPLTSQSNASGTTGHSFIMSGLNIPTRGCWQKTANYAGDKLTFVVWVAP